MLLKAFGKKPGGSRQQRIEQSPAYKDGAFQNFSHTDMLRKDASYFKIFKMMLSRPKTVTPSKPLPTVKTDLRALKGDVPQIVWFGHSSYFISCKGYNILVDPVLLGNASPISIFGKPFPGTSIYTADDIPEIDLLILTHDHYDHLDVKTVSAIKGKVKKVVTALGVGSHLEYWGYDANIITELDWWESYSVNEDVQLTAVPGRHFSGRGIKRNMTLWEAFAMELYGYKLFLGGDSGYDIHFKNVGDKYGPFDIALLESGQYGEYWPQIHMMPEQTVQAAKELKAKVLLPVHWAKFTLANHVWNEPIKRLVAAAKEAGQTIVTPMIGETYTLNTTPPVKEWWDFE